MKRALQSSGELSLIAAIRARAGRARSRVRVGIGDDCAVLRVVPGDELVVTTDFSLEGRHFRRDWHPPQSAGWRAAMRGLSDLAAMGAAPAGAFLSLAVPRGEASSRYLQGFLDGVFMALASAKTPLCGGDTAQSPDGLYLADMVLTGHVPRGAAMLRSTARAGDRLYCTGWLGGAAAELEALAANPAMFRRAGPGTAKASTAGLGLMKLDAAGSGTRLKPGAATPQAKHPHLYPQARLKAGTALRRRKLASACMDLSDGLSSDLAQLCEASGVFAEVDAARLPLHPLAEARGAAAAREAALHGGEDYELLFTARPQVKMPRTIDGIAVTEIGRIVARRRGRPQVALLVDGKRQALDRGGWEHLR